MRGYYELLDPAREPLLSEDLLARALRALAEAATLAAARPDVLARLDHLKQYQHYVRLRWEYDRVSDRNRKRDVALAILTHVYRNRYSYMNHWEAIRQQWTPVLAKEFDRPTWSFRYSPAKPWKVESPCTHEETERLFQEDLAYFQPQPVEEKAFSLDLLPGGFKSDKPVVASQRFQGRARYAFYSRSGERLELSIRTGLIAWYRDRPAAAYAFSDATGKEIAKGRLPQDGQEHRLAIDVTGRGLYWLEFDDQAAGWGITIPAGRPVSLAIKRDLRAAHMGHMQRMYFYVPKGTKELQYFWEGPPHEVNGPEGKPLASIASRGEFVRVAVPVGGDVQVWSFTETVPGPPLVLQPAQLPGGLTGVTPRAP